MVRRIPLISACLVLAGCAGGPAIEATSLLSYDQCQGIDTGLTEVDYADVAGIRGSRLLNLSRSAPVEEGNLLLVAISRGRQPTPGYVMTLDGAHRRDSTAVIEVRWQTPESGAVLAQMLTHPCLVVGLSRDGFTRVEAVDQSGDPLGSLSL